MDSLCQASPEEEAILPGDGAIASDDQATPLVQTDEEFWLENEGLTSERQFHNKLYYLVSRLSSAYMQGDLHGMQDALRRILWVHTFITAEPLLSVYTTGLVLGLLTVLFAVAFFAIDMIVKRGILSPLLDITESMHSISRGKLDTKIDFERNDEIGDLARSVELVRRSFEKVMQRISKLRQ